MLLGVEWAGRIARLVSVSAGASAGALAGAGCGVFVGIWAFALAWILSDRVGSAVPFYIGLFVVLPVCVLGGAWLGARLFLRFRAFAGRLRRRHQRVGALAWVLGSALLVLAAALGGIWIAAVVFGLLD